MSSRGKLTDRAAAAVQPAEHDLIVWDEALPGFGLRVKPTGVKSWVVDYRDEQGRKVRTTLGRFPNLGASAARREALSALGERKPSRRHDPQALTLADLWAKYRARVLAKRKPTTKVHRELLWRLHMMPKLGARQLATIDVEAVEDLLAGLEGPGTRANVHSLLAAMFNAALRWELWSGLPPTRKVERPKRRRRLRFLSTEEWERLGEALDWAEHHSRVTRSTVRWLRTVALTGLRKREALGLKAGDVNLAGRKIVLEDSKGGGATIPISEVAAAYLRTIMPVDGGLLFPGQVVGQPIKNPDQGVRTIMRHAGIQGVTAHALRHSLAEAVLASGGGLKELQTILGHKSLASTMVYAHIRDEAVRAAADRAGEALGSALRKKNPAG